ncbi:hypothetical protein N431DRAFT_321006 [Stipitochalara longipes BDJ]|nr:hypothetical protein N431DRAFT_321006 [Stipitochalara longipes BDJ]
MSTVNPQQEGAARPPQDRNLSKRTLKLQKWDSYRDEIYRIYVLQNHTLGATMKIIKENHNFAPSERKFKEKIKEWKFEKYLSTEEAKFIAMKSKAREEQGKDTTFYKHGIKVDQKRVEQSAKRKREVFDELGDFTARTHIGFVSR